MKQKDKEKISIPVQKLREGVILPKPSKPGDAGADARIFGFKKIIKNGEKKEFLDIENRTIIPHIKRTNLRILKRR
ncbi:MAG: hypothetical protein ACFFAK_10895 [Promethearchaeota archaeon]